MNTATPKPRTTLRTLLPLIALATLLASPSSRAAPDQDALKQAIAHALMADRFTALCSPQARGDRWERTIKLVEQRWQHDLSAEEARLRAELDEFGKYMAALSKRTGGCYGPQMQKLGNELHADWSSAYNKLVLQP
ncbi:hypothetical protein [Chitinilyticum litopenaei]|uniref:hypothetical protein n=1 Tax=Chitinilyticum litopenaei TaxID=1121276 RepID=UPI000413D09A|nr:hypothetical protein [Chitinilyticum litopenaei]